MSYEASNQPNGIIMQLDFLHRSYHTLTESHYVISKVPTTTLKSVGDSRPHLLGQHSNSFAT